LPVEGKRTGRRWRDPAIVDIVRAIFSPEISHMGRRGPVPTSPLLRMITGNAGKRRLPELITPTLPAAPLEPPAWLSSDAQMVWRELASELHRLGLLTVLDQSMLAAHCVSVARWKDAERELASVQGGSLGDPDHARLVRIARTAMADAMRFGQAFGLGSPARARLAADALRSGGKFTGLLA
jgi:P27 family predicted phage terminase small subunit